MKLKNILVMAFFALTLIPITAVSFLLYQSGLNLSKESYVRNLVESINVQQDYISQAIEHNMIADYRFANRLHGLSFDDGANAVPEMRKNDLLASFQSYLESSEDKIAVCVLLDRNNTPVYEIGEKVMVDAIIDQVPGLENLQEQTVREFSLENGVYSLGIITPIRDERHNYMGSLISIYDKSYIFKIISSYYKIADTSISIHRVGGDVIQFRKLTDEKQNEAIEQVLTKTNFASEGIIDTQVGDVLVSGYYKNIPNSPWYLIGFVDHDLICSFANQFIWLYMFIIIGIFVVDIFLSFYFSRKVVEPIKELIALMDDYQHGLSGKGLQRFSAKGYYETQYLRTKFLSLMQTISRVQHNFEGIYQLYQSSDMGDTNIDIDVKEQIVTSNKDTFSKLMQEVEVPDGACVVERFTHCFCEKDRVVLIGIFEKMRDEQLSVTREAEIYTPYFNQKWFHVLVVPMYDGDRLSRLFIQLRDVSGFKKQEFASIEMARRDVLTGLYNRAGFTEYVIQALQAEEGQAELNALLFIDMNYFKMVNDNFGHKVGDDLLCSVSRTLLNTVGHADIVSRFGGDEFVVFLPRTSLEAVEQMKEQLQERLVFPFSTEAVSFAVSVSIGVATWNNCTPLLTLEKLLQDADSAMYQAKRAFKEREVAVDKVK